MSYEEVTVDPKNPHEPTEEELDALIAEQSKPENLPSWWPKDALERLKRQHETDTDTRQQTM